MLLAYAGAHPLAAAALSRWTWEPFTVALLILSAVVYAIGLRVLWRRAGRDRGVRAWQAASFAAGLLTLAIALLSPLAWLSEVLFSAHMTQHELLMLVAAPLLVFGHPLLLTLWAMPPRWREGWARWTGRASTVSVWHAVTGPLAVFLLHAAALWIWHAPPLYAAALDHDGVHALQHLSFVLTAALFWWGMVHGRYGRIGYGVAVLYVFLTAVHSSVLGALMTVAPGVWYPAYAASARAWQVDALQDQQLAGLLMWVPSGLVFIVFGLALFAAWLGESDKRVRLGSTGRA
jgi:cytochrome c oxidase assembly factor CtaG